MAPQKRQVMQDDSARRRAIKDHKNSYLVEAAAGSGKTAVLAGRIAYMLADGIRPRHIAAITFTEFAASELFIRVREYVDKLASEEIPAELQVAWPSGISAKQRANLSAAQETIDDLVCTTIHGFCQRLSTAYPVEANIDPGATVLDNDQADEAFANVKNRWLRNLLDSPTNDLLEKLIQTDRIKALTLLNELLDAITKHRNIRDQELLNLDHYKRDLNDAIEAFSSLMANSPVQEDETIAMVREYETLSEYIEEISSFDEPDEMLAILETQLSEQLVTSKGKLKAYQKLGKWRAAGRPVGINADEINELCDEAEERNELCYTAWQELKHAAATTILNQLISLCLPVVDEYQTHKRCMAVLDFDDLILNTLEMLRKNVGVRNELAKRFSHILVDEFQDTDSNQSEILWLLCGETPTQKPQSKDWAKRRIKPGALFLVGDPKQAIYRFRGADIKAYEQARNAFREHEPAHVLSIGTNFRSFSPILDYVNEIFEEELSESKGQPGFQKLLPFQANVCKTTSVEALDLHPKPNAKGKVDSAALRAEESNVVAETCARLIGSRKVRDPKSGTSRPCRASDIGLLAPQGTDLWYYEDALEKRGIAIDTQAGKNFYRRQEIKDLIAIVRVLSNPRDYLALAALLRGPLVGLTEEDLLDIVWSLPRHESDPDRLPKLSLNIDVEHIEHDLARDIITKLQQLRMKIHSTTAHALLSEVVDVFCVRAILLKRHQNQAERALTNVDLFLGIARRFATQGLIAFSETQSEAWEKAYSGAQAGKEKEGRPDSEEDAVAIYTVHSAKGLEWPIVIPINMMSMKSRLQGGFVERTSMTYYTKVFGKEPFEYECKRKDENDEIERERVRLCYVAVTRARETLILPRYEQSRRDSWLKTVELKLFDLPMLEVPENSNTKTEQSTKTTNKQTKAGFKKEGEAISARQSHVKWINPSRDEDTSQPIALVDENQSLLSNNGDNVITQTDEGDLVQGSRVRGNVLHKLLEEVLTGEVADTDKSLVARAKQLKETLKAFSDDDVVEELEPKELAETVVRALAIPEIASLRPRLVPELTVYTSDHNGETEELTYGVADAIAFNDDGSPDVVVDWKSDVNPSSATIQHYRKQVAEYLRACGANRGLVVLISSGKTIDVQFAEAA
ncbi:MAG: AAA family ATPase [Gammaproteobacteria bacterium]|nr:AAA family ATPase [Gammaproteobacteria bacterium]